MTFANASDTRLAYIAEVTANTTPSSPAFQILRATGEALRHSKQTVVSNEIRSDRNVSDLAMASTSETGEIPFELSYGTLDSLMESALFSTWSSDVLKNGVTPKSFTFEKTFELGATDQYHRFTGIQIDTMALSFAAGAIVTGSLGTMGMGHTTGTAILTDATYSAGNTNEVLTAAAHVGSLTATGISGTPVITKLDLNIANGLREQRAIGNLGPVGLGRGRCVVTGTLEAYFEDAELYSAFVDHDILGLSWDVGAETGEKYNFDLPSIRLGDVEVVAGGNDSDVMISAPFQAIYDDDLSATIAITREVA
ncbi:MAG: phage tail tube protein [Parvibaculaceae bacterium]|nr:phage tail tube protein [Parvibaculaceae bacterium]